MSFDPHRLAPDGPQRDPIMPRLYLRDPAWHVALKHDSQREFCFTANPGEDFYHRLSANELYLHRGDEKICLRCADRFGLIEFTPRSLRESIAAPRLESGDVIPFELAPHSDEPR